MSASVQPGAESGPQAGSAWRKVCRGLLAAVCAVFALKLLFYHGWLICFPWPNLSREAAIMLTTDLLVKGGNPYLLASQPMYTNVYGLLYNLCVYPLARFLGPTLLLHTAVTGAFLLGCCGLFYVVLRRAEVARLEAWVGVLVLYASLLMRTTPLPGPDTLGTFLLLLTVFLPWLRKYSWPSLLLSALCGLAAFYTKPYFVLGVLCLGSYLFCFVSWKKGLGYAGLAGLLFAVSFPLVSHSCETYFYNVFLMHRNTATYDVGYMLRQLWVCIVFYRELLLLLSCAGGLALGRWWLARGRSMTLAPRFGAAWLSLKTMSLPVYGLGFMLLLFCFKMGGHTGNWLAYPFQLVSPFLLLVSFRALRDDRRRYVLQAVLLAASLVFISRNFVRQPAATFATHEKWEKIQSLVGSHTNILGAPPVAPLLMAQGKTVYDSGHTEAFVFCGRKKAPLPFLFPLVPQIEARNRQYLDRIAADIQAKRFDLLLLNPILSPWVLPPQAVIDAAYNHTETLRLFMPHSELMWTLEVWEPKP